MTPFWSLFVFAGTTAVLAGCWILLEATRRNEVENGAATEKDHDFDGIHELETPLPRWWLRMFVGTIVFAAVYLVLYPGLGAFPGVLGWTQEGQWQAEVEQAEARYAPVYEQYGSRPLPELAGNEEAMAMGRRIFGNFCSQCHGIAGTGAIGFPDLTDSEWIWGRSPDAVLTSIRDGRVGAMPGWNAALGTSGVVDMAQYVLSLTNRAVDPNAVQRARASWNTLCVACHGSDGTGDPSIGVPDLTDAYWLYGGDPTSIAHSIGAGRTGVMPAHESILSSAQIHLVAAWVLAQGPENPEPAVIRAATDR